MPFALSLAGILLFLFSMRLLRQGAEGSRGVGSLWRNGPPVAKAGLVLWFVSIALVLTGVGLFIL